MMGLWNGLVRAAAAAACLCVGAAHAALPSGVHHQTIYAPDFYGRKVVRTVINQTVSPATIVHATLDVSSKNCNPNAVTVLGGALFVICNSSWGGADQVLVYNRNNFKFIETITGAGTDGFPYFSGAGLLAGAFDKHNNLWLSGYASNSLYRIPLSQLTQSSPLVDRQIVDSPDSPAGLTFDTAGDMWVVGQYSGGILLGFTDATINAAGTYLHNSPLNPNPTYCLSNSLAGCNPTANLFNNPEGVAVFGGAVWVSNNGGDAPAATLVRAAIKSGGVITAGIYGGSASKPFACPGGLFAPRLAGATAELFVNDEGFGVATPTCGASQASQGSQIGGILMFENVDLLNHPSAPTPETYAGWRQLRTGSPGFGGLYVLFD